MIVKLNLSMSNSRKNFLSKIVLFILGFFILEFIIGSIFTYMHNYNLNSGFHTKLMWDDLYNKEDYSLDLVFSGSSHAMESFDPEIFDQALNIESFNLGTAAQKPQTGYYILQHVLQTQQPKLVVFEVYWAVMGTDYYPKQAVENMELIQDKSISKALFKDALSLKDQVLYQFKSYWYRGDISTFLKNIQGPVKSPYRYYKENGYVYSSTIFDSKDLKEHLARTGPIVMDPLNTEEGSQAYYLEKSIQLCQERNIEVLLVTSPLCPTYMQAVENYKETHETIQNIADKYQIEYMDYNIINEKEQLIKDENFRDRSHLNYSGVKIMNNHLINYLIENNYFT